MNRNFGNQKSIGRAKGVSFLVKLCFIGILLIVGNLSCDGEQPIGKPLPLTKISGSIIEYEATSLSQIESLTLGTEFEGTHKLKVDKDLGEFTPSHVRQHMVHGELVEIYYREHGGKKWLESINDISSQ